MSEKRQDGVWFNLNLKATVILNKSGAAFLSGRTGGNYNAGDVYEAMLHDIISTFGRHAWGFTGPFEGNDIFLSNEDLALARKWQEWERDNPGTEEPETSHG